MICGKINMSWSYDRLEKEYTTAISKIRDLETELYFCRRNKKLSTCSYCNRNDGTCGCGKKPDCGIGCEI